MTEVARRAFLARLELQRKSLRDEIEGDIAPLRGLSLEERGRILEAVCRDAMAILRARPDFARAIEHRDPLSVESSRTWEQLVERFRKSNGRD